MVTGRTLLLADDSATIQKVVDLTFSDEGLRVVTVGDGQQALEKLDEIVPDIVLADVFMPGLNGYQVCEHIKRTERFRHIPVMLLVGSFEPFDEAEARRVGADDYLTKPFQSIRTLISKVGNLLSGGGGSDEATTRRLAPPPEAEKENRPDSGFLERATADTAPLPEAGSGETERGGKPGAFADLSMDDQMIETLPGDDYENRGQTDRLAEHARPTKQYSAADLREAGIAAAVEGEETARQREAAAPSYAPVHTGEPSGVAAGGQAPAGTRASNIASSEDALLDLGDVGPTEAMTEADDFFLDLLDEDPAPRAQSGARSSASTYAPPFEAAPAATAPSGAESADASARASYEEQTAETEPQAQEFVDAEVISEDRGVESAA
ncbi:MAG TPA: response regulator, partial [Pyrinomonadaceae bacterium]|nr:response regulator [Pyrinomonadaceae bacterium]